MVLGLANETGGPLFGPPRLVTHGTSIARLVETQGGLTRLIVGRDDEAGRVDFLHDPSPVGPASPITNELTHHATPRPAPRFTSSSSPSTLCLPPRPPTTFFSSPLGLPLLSSPTPTSPPPRPPPPPAPSFQGENLCRSEKEEEEEEEGGGGSVSPKISRSEECIWILVVLINVETALLSSSKALLCSPTRVSLIPPYFQDHIFNYSLLPNHVTSGPHPLPFLLLLPMFLIPSSLRFFETQHLNFFLNFCDAGGRPATRFALHHTLSGRTNEASGLSP